MESILIGNSVLQASRLAYGCWRILGATESLVTSQEHEAAARKAIATAYESGFTLFDHADVYAGGEAERTFGKVLKEINGMRERIVIVTKCGIRKQGEPSPESPYRYDFSAGHIVWSCEQSLKRLGVETIDVFLLHRPDFLCDPAEVAGAFARLKQAGKVREFGVSNFSPSQFSMLQTNCPLPLVANQVEISLGNLARFADGTLDQCTAQKVTPMAWSPLDAGRLATNIPIDLRDPDHARRIHVRETLDLIARERESTRPVVALAWLLRHPAGIMPVVGSADPERIREQAKAVDLELSREEWYRLLEAALGHRLP